MTETKNPTFRPRARTPMPAHRSQAEAAQALSFSYQTGTPTPCGPKRRGQPFRDAEACIVWAITRLAAEADDERTLAETAICTPLEVVKCLDTLYRRRRIDLHHVRILRLWAHRGRAPDKADPKERGDWKVWREALDRLDWPLRFLGIIS